MSRGLPYRVAARDAVRPGAWLMEQGEELEPLPSVLFTWDYGTDLSYLRELVQYWRDGFDWRAAEAGLNRLPHFRTDVDDLGIHFIHARSPVEDAFPLLITHGWPGSIFEFSKIIAPYAG